MMDKNRILPTRHKHGMEKRENRQKMPNPNNFLDTPIKRYNDNQKNPKISKKNFPKSISSEKLQNQAYIKDNNDTKEFKNKLLESEYKPRMHHKNKKRDNANNSFDNTNCTYTIRASKKIANKLNKENNTDKFRPYNINNDNNNQINSILFKNNNNHDNNERNQYNDVRNENYDINEKRQLISRNKKEKKQTTNNTSNININNDNSNNDGNPKFSFMSLLYTESNKNTNNINNKKNMEADNILKKNIFVLPKNNNKSSSKKIRSASAEKSNATYSNFINKLKKQMLINKNMDNKNMDNKNMDNKYKNKKKKNVFYNFLNQFINKNEKDEPGEHSTKNVQNFVNNTRPNRNKNTARKFTNIHKKKITHFFILGNKSNNNNIPYNNNESFNYELLNIKKELELKENTIRELLKTIDKQNNDYNIIYHENQKLKEEINNLKNQQNNYNVNSNNYKNNNDNSIFENNISTNKENAKYNNLITYNINKNNNYNIINSEIKNFNGFIQNNNNINNNEPILTNNNINNIELKQKDNNKKETDQEKRIRRERKASQAFERFKKINRMNTNQEEENQKSSKISDMAKMLEDHIGDKAHNRRENSVDVCGRVDNKKIDVNNYNNDVINIIDKQPVVNKKKKKMRSFSFDG